MVLFNTSKNDLKVLAYKFFLLLTFLLYGGYIFTIVGSNFDVVNIDYKAYAAENCGENQSVSCSLAPQTYLDSYCKSNFDTQYTNDYNDAFSGVSGAATKTDLTYRDSGTVGSIGVCAPSSYTHYNVSDVHYSCPSGTSGQILNGVLGCCPNGFGANRNPGAGSGGFVYCCPPGYRAGGTDQCFNDVTNSDWDPNDNDVDSIEQNYGKDVRDDAINSNRINGTMIAEHFRYSVDRSTSKLYGCFNQQYSCPFYRVSIGSLPPITFNENGDAIEGNLLTVQECGGCVRNCHTADLRPINIGELNDQNLVCVPTHVNNGQVVGGLANYAGDAKTLWDNECSSLCGVSDDGFLDGDNGSSGGISNPQGCDSIEDPEEQAQCLECVGDPDSSNNVWTGIGCVEATSTGFTTRIFQIAIGITGFIVIIRIIQIVILLNNPDTSKDNPAEAREIGLSIVYFALVLGAGLLALRFLGYNVLGITVPFLGPI